MKKKYYLFQISEVALNVISVIMFIIMAFITELCYMGEELVITYTTSIWIVLLMFPYLMLHEIIHSISYVLNGANFKNVTYGVHLEKGVFCCLCKQNITKRNILICRD